MEAKRRELEALLKDMGGVLVAFSGGVDSSVLLAAAHIALGDLAVAATGTSVSVPAHDLESARTISSQLGVRWFTTESGELDDLHYRGNPQIAVIFAKRVYLHGYLYGHPKRACLLSLKAATPTI